VEDGLLAHAKQGDELCLGQIISRSEHVTESVRGPLGEFLTICCAGVGVTCSGTSGRSSSLHPDPHALWTRDRQLGLVVYTNRAFPQTIAVDDADRPHSKQIDMAMEQPLQRDTTPLPCVTNFLPVSAQQTTHPSSKITLPDLKTVLSNDYDSLSSLPEVHQHNHASPGSHVPLPRIDPIFTNMLDRQISLESGMASPVTTASGMSLDDRGGPRSVVSVEDENVLIAAQALSGLGNPGECNRWRAIRFHTLTCIHSLHSERRTRSAPIISNASDAFRRRA
jgi:hypothetical protein